MEIKIRKPLEISTKLNTKTLCTFFSFASVILKNIEAYNQAAYKAWNVINHNYHNYISCLRRRALFETPSGVSKFDFSDNFGSKISAQVQNFTSCHCRGVNLVEGSVLCIHSFIHSLFGIAG